LILTNTYFVGSPGQTTVTVQDTNDLSTNVVVAAINGPSGIDYHPVNTSLIISRGDTVAGTMLSEKGSASVPVALFGVSPNRWGGRFYSPIGAPRQLLPARRRDADGRGRDDRAPHLQLHRSGLEADKNFKRLASSGSNSGLADFRLASLRRFSTVRSLNSWQRAFVSVFFWARAFSPAFRFFAGRC